MANSLIAVDLGAHQVQGTINGYGERCGNANLCTIIPNLKLKMDIHPITDEEMRKLREVSRFVSEIANLRPNDYDPYVGKSAFTHKGGIHVSAISRYSATYEHVPRKRWVTREEFWYQNKREGATSLIGLES